MLSISDRSSIVLWLLTGCFLIFTMVVVGGITRLTGSGLSITKWDVVTGTLPPVTESDWAHEFELYKQTPQYQKINGHFELSDFKGIYWWEYIHRLLGRLIGLVFVIPFAWFVVRGKMDRKLIWKCLLLFALGGLQGFFGWYMVKSGLIDEPSVSHFRLALHLCTAFITFCFTLWFAMDLINTEKVRPIGWIANLNRYVKIVLAITFVQIVFGAFVAGLKAGLIYNTWPLMGDTFIPDSVFYAVETMGWHGLIDNMSGVQFVHRNLAYIVFFGVLFLLWYAWKNNRNQSKQLLPGQMTAVWLCSLFVVLQFVLGIFTLLHAVPLWLGVIHQAGALLLLGSLVYLWHQLEHVSVSDNRILNQ